MISILLPVFNAAPFLSDCLQSVVQQTETNWELLAVDDFSTDASYELLAAFAKKDDRIQVFKDTEKGIISALRLAFAKSRGQFITRMDADDLMMPDKLMMLKSKLQALGAGHITTGHVQYFSDTALGDGYRKYQDWLNHLVDRQNHYEYIYKECVLPSPTWMMYRKDLKQIGGFEAKRYPEDYDLCFRAYANGLKIVGIPKIIHQWRDHPERTSRTNPVYADARFLDLKLFWFLKTDYDHKRPLVIWGAGRKGKAIAQFLIERNIPFFWMTDNKRKQGVNIYGQILKSRRIFEQLTTPTTIIAVAAPDAQPSIDAFFKKRQATMGQDYFWFC